MHGRWAQSPPGNNYVCLRVRSRARGRTAACGAHSRATRFFLRLGSLDSRCSGVWRRWSAEASRVRFTAAGAADGFENKGRPLVPVDTLAAVRVRQRDRRDSANNGHAGWHGVTCLPGMRDRRRPPETIGAWPPWGATRTRRAVAAKAPVMSSVVVVARSRQADSPADFGAPPSVWLLRQLQHDAPLQRSGAPPRTYGPAKGGVTQRPAI